MMGLACAYLITVDDASAFEIQYELQWDLRSTHNYAVVFDDVFGGARKFGIHDKSWGILKQKASGEAELTAVIYNQTGRLGWEVDVRLSGPKRPQISLSIVGTDDIFYQSAEGTFTGLGELAGTVLSLEQPISQRVFPIRLVGLSPDLGLGSSGWFDVECRGASCPTSGSSGGHFDVTLDKPRVVSMPPSGDALAVPEPGSLALLLAATAPLLYISRTKRRNPMT